MIDPNYYGSVPIVKNNMIENGKVFQIAGQLHIGTRPLTYVEETMRRLIKETIRPEWIKALNLLPPTGEQIIETLKKQTQ